MMNPLKHVFSAKGHEPWQSAGPDGPDPSNEIEKNPDLIHFTASERKQQIDGFGGCFNEMGGAALNNLTESQRQDLMQALFGEEGCRFNICRMPIGASDFSFGYYSLAEHENDYAMENFSIDRDRTFLLPYVKYAASINPDLQVWGSPWCPPKWMKKNGLYKAGLEPWDHVSPGDLRWEPEVLNALCLYLEKFIRSYREEGIQLTGIHVQNEPWASQDFPSCRWSGQQLAVFIKDYLGPHVERSGLDAEIWHGTTNHGIFEETVSSAIRDPDCMNYITGFGFQWNGQNVLPIVNQMQTGKKYMATETMCGDGKNDWEYVWQTAYQLQHYFHNGAHSYMQWNMILDQSGSSYWGWPQNSMVSILTDRRNEIHDRPENREADWVQFHPQFYLVKHVSHFVRPGATYVQTNKHPEVGCILFENPDGSLVAVFTNTQSISTAVRLTYFGSSTTVSLAPYSVNTVIYKPDP